MYTGLLTQLHSMCWPRLSRSTRLGEDSRRPLHLVESGFFDEAFWRAPHTATKAGLNHTGARTAGEQCWRRRRSHKAILKMRTSCRHLDRLDPNWVWWDPARPWWRKLRRPQNLGGVNKVYWQPASHLCCPDLSQSNPILSSSEV